MANNNSCQTILSEQLEKVLSGTPLSDKLDAAKVSFADAYQDEELIKLFAVLDMYFNMFLKSKYAKLRVGKIVLSYKDCSALALAAHGATVMQKTTRGFARWLMTDALRKDLFRINVPYQEVSIPYSYMPYFMPLKLSEKSPYSASANPSLHMFVHLVGCAYGVKRSINAIFVTPEGIKSILSNVYLCVYAHSRMGDLGAQHYGKSDEATVNSITTFYKKLAEEEMKDAKGKSEKDKTEPGIAETPKGDGTDKTEINANDYPDNFQFFTS